MGAPKRILETEKGDAQAAYNTAKAKADKTGTDFKRGFLAVSTLGTSEIKTGGGEYGDETLADSLFPKTINDLMSDERTAARKVTDEANKPKSPGLVPDLADQLLAGAGRRGRTSSRKSAFLTSGIK